MKRTQLDLLPKEKFRAEFGGSLCRTRRGRTVRPLSEKHPIHVVLRSSKATGAMSLRHPSRLNAVDRLFQSVCREHGLTVHEYANVGNHIHALVKIPNRTVYKRWIRKVTARIACLVTKARKGVKAPRFWDFRPFTRIVFGWTGFRIASAYVEVNRREARGELIRAPKSSLKTEARPPRLR